MNQSSSDFDMDRIMKYADWLVFFQRSSRNSKSVSFREEHGQGQGQEAVKKVPVQETAPRKNNGQCLCLI